MYDPQLEKLIAIALKDGIVTDKERQILIKKAIEFGVDVDEFEMELDSRIPTKGDEKPLMNIGNDNIVKETIQGGGNALPPVPGKPIMNIGNDNVIKAEIDASTNVTHDNSVKVKGTFVAQQTVINVTNSPGAEFIKSLSSFLERGSGSKKQIEEQLDRLPNNTNVLLKTLSELCRFIFRELSKFYSDKEKVSEYKLKKVGVWGEDPIIKQIEYAKKILDKLHEVAFDNRDEKLKATITKLDEIVFSFPRLYGNLVWKEQLPILNFLLWVPIAILVLLAIIAIIAFSEQNGKYSFNDVFILLLVTSALLSASYGIYRFKIKLFSNKTLLLETNKKSLQDDDKYLQDLIESIKTV